MCPVQKHSGFGFDIVTHSAIGNIVGTQQASSTAGDAILSECFSFIFPRRGHPIVTNDWVEMLPFLGNYRFGYLANKIWET